MEYLLRVLLLKMRDVVTPDTEPPDAALYKVRHAARIEALKKLLGEAPEGEPAPSSLSLKPLLRLKTLTFNNLGVLYSRAGKNEKALQYLLRSLEV